MVKKILVFILIFFILNEFLVVSIKLISSAPENLDEMFNRKSRRTTAEFPLDLLENKTNYIWQPETLMYYDNKTGHEVWKISNTPNLNNYFHNDIGVSPWSADGKRMAFVSYRDTNAYETNEGIWFIVNTNGAFLKPVINGPSRTYHHTLYFHWSPQIPDVYYEFGRNSAEQTGLRSTDLYKAYVSDFNISKKILLSFPTDKFSELKLDKTISPDGRKIIAMSWDDSWVYPATIYPDNKAELDDDGYSIDRNMDSRWGDTPESYSSLHDQYLVGDGSWIEIMPSNSHAHWRLKVLGSASDGGSSYSFSEPDIFDEEWPENTRNIWGGINDPFSDIYWSHPVYDNWGRYVLFSYTENPMGPSVWDIRHHKYSVKSFGGGTQHHDWHGFSDWCVSSGIPYPLGYLDQRIYTEQYNDSNSRKTVCFTHTLYNSNGDYQGAGNQYFALVRPSQSPDGTKIAWHSTFLQPDDSHSDIFWTVAYYPKPPTNLEANYSNGIVNIKFLPPRYTERNWPFANETKNNLRNGNWPELDSQDRELGEPIYAREIKKFHVWKALSKNGPWNEIGSVNYNQSYKYHVTEDPNNELFMLHPIDLNGYKISPENKLFYSDSISEGTYYYAITSEEYSGLESKELSEIIKINITNNKLDFQIVQKQGKTNFWTTPPPKPLNFNYTKIKPGQFLLSWNAPNTENSDKIRYYNIYYSSFQKPLAIQKYRIASITKEAMQNNKYTYLDWLANESSNLNYYGITSVDRYGNEAEIVYLSEEQENYNDADKNHNKCIEINELQDYITNEWLTGKISLSKILIAVNLWKNGCPY